MAMKRVRLQKGLSLPDFPQRFGTEEQSSAQPPWNRHVDQTDFIPPSVAVPGILF